MESSVNQRIKFLRKTLGLSQTSFAIKIGIAQTTLSQIEKGKTGVSPEVFSSIVTKLNVYPQWLEDGSGNMIINQKTDISETKYSKYSIYDEKTLALWFKILTKNKNIDPSLISIVSFCFKLTNIREVLISNSELVRDKILDKIHDTDVEDFSIENLKKEFKSELELLNKTNIIVSEYQPLLDELIQKLLTIDKNGTLKIYND